jgi:hypothetical protein
MAGIKDRKRNGKRLATPQSVNAAIKSICAITQRSNCVGALFGFVNGDLIHHLNGLQGRPNVTSRQTVIEAEGREVADALSMLRRASK